MVGPLTVLDQHRFRSVAFPIIGSGSGNRSRKRALEVMLEAFTPLHSPATVVIVAYRRAAQPSGR